MTNTAIIVDAYSTGSDLPWRLKEANYHVVHIANDLNAPELTSSLKSEAIDETIELSSVLTTSDLFKTLKIITPSIVLPGTETGIELADMISDELSLCGNSQSSSLKRRNKTLMQGALQSAGLDFIRGFIAKNVNDIDKYFSYKLKLPCVVKPEMSAGVDDVFFCGTLDEIKDAVKKIVGRKNQIGGLNEATPGRSEELTICCACIVR